MGGIARIASAIGAALVVNAIAYHVLLQNQQAGIYSPEADTILIPIVENAAVSVVVLVLLIGGLVCSRAGTVLKTIGILLGLLATGAAALAAFEWMIPNHYLIASAFGLLSATSAALMYLSFRRRASNSTPHADARDVPASAGSTGARAGGRDR
jgi:hypothetical protein